MNAQDIQGILFDLDDTLYDRKAAFAQWTRQFLQTECGMTDEAALSEACESIAVRDASGYGSKHSVIEELQQRYSPADKQSEDHAAAFYDSFISTIVLDAAAVRLLDQLDRQEIPWGIVTNGTPKQWDKLDRLGLKGRTPCLFVSETFGSEKPDAPIYLAAAQAIGRPVAQTLFVGDHPYNDIAGAAQAGMHTAWIRRGKPWPAELGTGIPDLTMDSLDELAAFLTA